MPLDAGDADFAGENFDLLAHGLGGVWRRDEEGWQWSVGRERRSDVGVKSGGWLVTGKKLEVRGRRSDDGVESERWEGLKVDG